MFVADRTCSISLKINERKYSKEEFSGGSWCGQSTLAKAEQSELAQHVCISRHQLESLLILLQSFFWPILHHQNLSKLLKAPTMRLQGDCIAKHFFCPEAVSHLEMLEYITHLAQRT